MFKKIADIITKVNTKIAIASSLLILPLIGVVTYEVIFRYFFNKPTNWAYDLTWMLYATPVFLGGAMTLAEDGHVKADIIYAALSRKWQAVLDLICYPLFFFSSVLGLIFSTYFLMIKAWMFGEKSVYTSWNPPTAPMKTILFISIVMLFFQGIVKYITSLRDLGKFKKEVKNDK